MPRKKTAAPADSPAPAARRWWLQVAGVLLVSVGLVAGLIIAGRWGIEQLRGRDRYLISFVDVDCEAPAGMSRREFLEEVQYEARFPDRFGVLDEDLHSRLKEAFAAHPWVRSVKDVEISPPKSVRVKLVFRRPVLAVRWDGSLAAVDGEGVRLPKNADTGGLPVYPAAPSPPHGKAGTRWGDAKLEDFAAKLEKRDGP